MSIALRWPLPTPLSGNREPGKDPHAFAIPHKFALRNAKSEKGVSTLPVKRPIVPRRLRCPKVALGKKPSPIPQPGWLFGRPPRPIGVGGRALTINFSNFLPILNDEIALIGSGLSEFLAA